MDFDCSAGPGHGRWGRDHFSPVSGVIGPESAWQRPVFAVEQFVPDHCRIARDGGASTAGSESLFEITISTCYAKLSVPIFGSKAILTRTMPAWCLFNASGHGYRALTSLCRPRQPIEINDSNRL